MKYVIVLLSLVLLACVPQDQGAHEQPNFSRRYIQPTNGYSQMVVVEQNGIKTLHISGQVGVGDELETQMKDVLNKLGTLLESEGGSYADLVKINTYIVNINRRI